VCDRRLNIIREEKIGRDEQIVLILKMFRYTGFKTRGGFASVSLRAKPSQNRDAELAWLEQWSHDTPSLPRKPLVPVLGNVLDDLDWASSFDWARSMTIDSCISFSLKSQHQSLANRTKTSIRGWSMLALLKISDMLKFGY
jgi:hypothetical protein